METFLLSLYQKPGYQLLSTYIAPNGDGNHRLRRRSRSCGIFPLTSPLTGMETKLGLVFNACNALSTYIAPNGDGNEGISAAFDARTTFPLTSPLTGMETHHHVHTLSRHCHVFPLTSPLTGMET